MHKNLEGKLNKFKQMIFEELEADLKAERERVDREVDADYAEKRAHNQANADDFYKTRMANVETRLSQNLSAAKMAKKNAELSLRSQIIDEIMQELYAKAELFKTEKMYQHYLEQQIKRLIVEIKDNDLTVYNLDNDKQFLQELFEKEKLNVLEWKELKANVIGGVIIELPKKRIRYNISLRNAIEQKRDHIVGVLYELLEGMVD